MNALYDIPDKLFALKDELETHLCSRTDHLFNIENRIVLFDLTNFYFEGRKAQSRKAAFRRSKEKRSDCRMLVFALCINTEGFIRYSSILEGNATDPASLPDMVRMLSAKSSNNGRRTLVVMDAGIATSNNLRMLRRMGYDYLCVTRNRIKNYTISPDHTTVEVADSRGKRITLRWVQPTGDGDTYFEVISPSKALTEASTQKCH